MRGTVGAEFLKTRSKKTGLFQSHISAAASSNPFSVNTQVVLSFRRKNDKYSSHFMLCTNNAMADQ